MFIVLVYLFVFLLFVGAALDRIGVTHFKWWVAAFLAILGIAHVIRIDPTIAEIKDFVTSWATWGQVLAYVGIGALYAILEFFLHLRKDARMIKAQWDKPDRYSAQDFVSRHRFSDYHLTRIEVGPGNTVNVKVDKGKLTDHLAVWTLFWPFYATTLIVGDFVDAVFTKFRDGLLAVSNKAVDLIFRDIFK